MYCLIYSKSKDCSLQVEIARLPLGCYSYEADSLGTENVRIIEVRLRVLPCACGVSNVTKYGDSLIDNFDAILDME